MKIVFVQTNYDGFLEKFYKRNPDWEKMTYSRIKDRWRNEWFGSADFYVKNITPYGWNATELIINDWNMQSAWAKENKVPVRRFEPSFFKYIPPTIKNYLGLQEWIKQIFFAQIKKIKPDIIYNHDLSILSVEDIKKLKKTVKLVVGQIAYPLPLNREPLKYYDLIISSFPHYVEMFREMGIKSDYLRWCIESSIPKTICKKKRVYDVVYIGGLTPHHSKGNSYLAKLVKEVKVDIWGYGENTLPLSSPIRKNFHGQAWGKDMYEIFAQSKIVINRHIDVSGPYANNMRMFEATGMGALLITDEKKNMDEFFKVGREVVTYKNPKDLVSKVKYYLKHDKEREAIAAAGRKRTLKDHTYIRRMKDLKDILCKHLAKE